MIPYLKSFLSNPFGSGLYRNEPLETCKLRIFELTVRMGCCGMSPVRQNPFGVGGGTLMHKESSVLRTIAIWTLAVVLGLLFVLVGLSKMSGPSGMSWAVRFSHWGYPVASRYVIGGIEILAGLGLLVPSFRRFAAITLMVVMSGAFATHLIHAEFVRLLSPLILGGLSYGLYSWGPRAPRKE